MVSIQGIEMKKGRVILFCLFGVFLCYVLFRKNTPEEVSLKSILAVSIQAAIRGGEEVKRIRAQADIGEKSKGETKEGANNPVTEGDMLSHVAMFFAIQKAFPNVRIISEEHDDRDVDLSKIETPSFTDKEVDNMIADSEDVVVPVEDIDVWIDPLDATQEYTENLKEYVTTMVCVAVRGEPTLGVIYKPFENRISWGWAGLNKVDPTLAGEFNANKMVSTDLSKSQLIVSRSHAGEVHDAAAKALGDKIKVTKAGGAGYKVLEVVKGNQNAYVHVTLIKKWDICPGNAILKALGGRLTTLDGEDIDYSNKDEKNDKGVLASVYQHSEYINKFQGLLKVSN